MLAAGAAVPLLGLIDRLGAAAAPLAPMALPVNASSFKPLIPVRIVDTRPAEQTGYPAFGFERIDGRTIRVQVAGRGGVPVGAVAAVLNVTATNPAGAGWVKVVPTGSAPTEVSNVNVERPGQILANLVTVQLSASGQVDIVCYDLLDIVVDVAGAYVGAPGAVVAGRFVALA